ncbi:MAG TPA: pyruvate kinase [Kosmotogaceae bacterium]|nr:pyruvate kinase [Kosmotogaceae bacterium]
MRKTKIVCTIGPATESSEMLELLARKGMNVARLNTSHGDVESHRATIRTIKKVRDQLSLPIAILLDLSGPKLRTGDFCDDLIELKEGQEFVLTTDKIVGDASRVSVNYEQLPREVNEGDEILLDDGKVKLVVTNVKTPEIYTRVEDGGQITHRRGINIPGAELGISAVTEKDERFIELGAQEQVDFFALSFVRKPDDVKKARRMQESLDIDIPIISKIETKRALHCIEEIALVSDGLMVARGDLGVEIPVEEVPIAQKRIIRAGNLRRIPVITATQMLESMIENPVPTRAETTDISNAILDGTDAVMLSAETSIGKYPDRAVSVMHRTALSTESYFYKNPYLLSWTREHTPVDDDTTAICMASWTISESLDLKLIVTSTFSGHTARNVSGLRPCSHILAMTPNQKTYYLLALVWGVTPVISLPSSNTDEIIDAAGKKARSMGIVEKGEAFILTAGIPPGVKNTTNILKIERV